MRTLVALAFLVAACRTDPTPATPPPPPPASAPVPVVPPVVSTRGEIDAAPVAYESDAAPYVDAPIASTGCSTNADCVLSATPIGCCSCPLGREHAMLKRALEARDSRCATVNCTSPRCPKVERYDPAFYRAECHTGRCVVVRWHTGG